MLKKYLLLGAGLMLLSFFLACAHTQKGQVMQVSTAQPAAVAKVDLGTTQNGDTSVDMKVERLSEPSRMSPGATTYVVWARPSSGDMHVQKIGSLKVDDKLNGELRTVVPYQDFQLFVTVENSGGVLKPSGDPLVWTMVQRKAE